MAHLSFSGSLCAVSDLSVISKTSDEEVSHSVTFDHHGNIVSTVPSHLGQGQSIEHFPICFPMNYFLSEIKIVFSLFQTVKL